MVSVIQLTRLTFFPKRTIYSAYYVKQFYYWIVTNYTATRQSLISIPCARLTFFPLIRKKCQYHCGSTTGSFVKSWKLTNCTVKEFNLSFILHGKVKAKNRINRNLQCQCSCIKAGFHSRRSHNRNRNQKCTVIRSSENQTDGVGSRISIPLMTPTIWFPLDHKRRSRKRNRKKWKRSDSSDSDSVEL